MQIKATSFPGSARLAAETLAQELVWSMPPETLARAFGHQRTRLDWSMRVGGPPLRVDNPNAPALKAGPAWRRRFDDGSVHLRSGAAGQWTISADQQINSRLLMPQGVILLAAQQWARSGALPVHAAAMEINGRGVLALGRRGAGKSITALAALAAGHRLVSDDWVLLGLDDDHNPAVERLREFLMLRHGWAASRIAEMLPDLPFATGHRSKSTYRLSNRDDPRFPVGCHIDELWLLERPRSGRARDTVWQPAVPATAMAHLIEASAAVLFGGAFPHEQRAALATLRQLIAGVECRVVTAGTDLVEDPGRVIEAMLQSGPVT